MRLLATPSGRRRKTGRTAFALAAALLGAAAAPLARAGGDAPAPKWIDVPTLKKEIAARHGKVVVVNLWATWCSGCVEEFPDLVKAAKTDAPRGLDLITISFDDAPSIAKAVVPFLAKNHLKSGTFVNRNGSKLDDAYPEFLEPELGPDDPFGIPRTYIFDRNGKLVKAIVGQETFAQFQSAILPILARR